MSVYPTRHETDRWAIGMDPAHSDTYILFRFDLYSGQWCPVSITRAGETEPFLTAGDIESLKMLLESWSDGRIAHQEATHEH